MNPLSAPLAKYGAFINHRDKPCLRGMHGVLLFILEYGNKRKYFIMQKYENNSKSLNKTVTPCL